MLQHPVPEKHLKSIGDITVSFALLESVIQTFIGSLLNERQRIGQVITAELPFRNLRALAISLYIERHGKDEDFDKLRAFMIRAGKVEDKRNQITHSVWGAGKDKDSITRIKATAKEKHGIQFHFEDVSADNLEEFAVEIKALATEIQAFWIGLIESSKLINDYTRQRLP
jgi:hypothetical protein